MTIALIDYGAGNLFSVERALKAAGADYCLANRPEQIIRANKLILPGVGAFADGMKGLKKNRLDQALVSAVNRGVPLLGICLGMQLMMSRGQEFGTHPGLNLIKGEANQINTKAKLPQIGWNDIKIKRPQSPLLNGINSGDYFYFVHSYVTRPENPAAVAAITIYGGDEFCSILSYNHLYGTQFHPEKSGEQGLKIYRNFVRQVRPAAGS